MPIEEHDDDRTQQVWLTQDGCERLKDELLEPPDDGIAEPGMVLTVSYADGDEETFLLAEREQDAYPDVEVCSPESRDHSPCRRAAAPPQA
jgi:hypothetical protein